MEKEPDLWYSDFISSHGTISDGSALCIASCYRMMVKAKLMNTGFLAMKEENETGILGKEGG